MHKLLFTIGLFSAWSSAVCAECIDKDGGRYQELCAEVSVVSGVRSVGQAVDVGTEINHQKPVLHCGNGFFRARSEYKVEILRNGPGVPNIGEPFAVQVRERIECLTW